MDHKSPAWKYIEAVQLPPPKGEAFEAERRAELAPDLNTDTAQSVVVGSDIVSFANGVAAERRQDIVNSVLLAQLAANKAIGKSDLLKWYDKYLETLSNTGWVIEDKKAGVHKEESENFEAHDAIEKIAAVLFGAAPTALALVRTMLDTLKDPSKKGPWITVFNRESQTAETANFQVTSATAEGSDVVVRSMAFGLKARADVNQVLVFKFSTNTVELRHASAAATSNDEVLQGVRAAIAARLAAYTADYVRKIDI